MTGAPLAPRRSSSVQLQRAGKQETEPVGGSHFSHQLVLQQPPPSQFPKTKTTFLGHECEHAERTTLHNCSFFWLLWLNSVPTRTWFFLLTASQALLAPPQSRCHFWDSLWFRVTEPRPGCEDRRAPGVRRAPIRPGGWQSKRQRRPLMCCRRRNIFFH